MSYDLEREEVEALRTEKMSVFKEGERGRLGAFAFCSSSLELSSRVYL